MEPSVVTEAVTWQGTGLLSATVLLPLAGAIFIALFLRERRLVRGFALVVITVDLLLSLLVFALYDSSEGGYQLVDRFANWIPFLKAEYHLGVDGISAPLVLLAGLLGAAAVWASWHIEERAKEYFMWLLVLQTAVMGVFTSLDFLLFFIFWELELVPMFFLISVWGSGRREYSAMKFLIFTLTGSAFMLVGILVLYFSAGTFSIVELTATAEAAKLLIPAGLVFAFLFVGFAIKLPVWPLHTWLPDAHTDAPTAVSVMLAGVLLKMGGYGIIRINVAMFPDVTRDIAWLLATLGVINVLYGAMVTLRQTDLKRLVAFSSISHMGYVLLGVASLGTVGLTGAALQMFTHGTITGLLFLLVGLVYDKAHTRHIGDLGGLASRMPFVASVFLVAGLASLGLPGLSGFVAEVLVFLGAFPVWGLATVLGAFGIVVAAGYILWMIQRCFFGPARERFAHIGDATLVEMIPVVALVAAIVVVGVYPRILTDVLTTGVSEILTASFGLG
ncbi:MAG: NADH-quinone oxidoreductase subunit M [Dehalococcoidia bacterium]|nr:NADH-quinone oxidoreductase subunit M [Dehalococcoidia bacterium]